MKNNINTTERVIRVIIGLAIVAVGFYYSSWWGLIGLEVGLTGLFGWSPLYRLFDISTSSSKKSHGYMV